MFSWLEHELQVMPGIEYLLLLGVILVILGALLYFAFGAFRRFRFIDATATSRIRSAAQGQVEIKGLAEWLPDGTIQSPFSDTRCVWYHCTIEKRRRSGKRTTWTSILDECSNHLFRLVDETGECIIDPEHAHVIPETDHSWYGVSQEARRRPVKTPRWVVPGFGNYRFRERLIRPATQLYALGWFRTLQNNASVELVTKQVEELIATWKLQPLRYLKDFDFDKNGKIQQAEWKAIRAAARRRVLARINRESRPLHFLSRPEDRRHPYILSAVDEEALLTRKKWVAYSTSAGAFVLFGLLVSLISIRSPLSP